MSAEFNNDTNDQRDYGMDRDSDWRDSDEYEFEYDVYSEGAVEHMDVTATRTLSTDKEYNEERENGSDGSDESYLGLGEDSDIPKIASPKTNDDYKLGKVLYDDLNATVNSIKDAIEFAQKNGYKTLEIPKGLVKAVDGLTIVDIFLYANDYMDDMKDGNYRGAFTTSFNAGLGVGFSLVPVAGPFLAVGFGYASDQYDWGETVYDIIQSY